MEVQSPFTKKKKKIDVVAIPFKRTSSNTKVPMKAFQHQPDMICMLQKEKLLFHMERVDKNQPLS